MTRLADFNLEDFDVEVIAEGNEEEIAVWRRAAAARGEIVRHYLEHGVSWDELEPVLRQMTLWKRKVRDAIERGIFYKGPTIRLTPKRKKAPPAGADGA